MGLGLNTSAVIRRCGLLLRRPSRAEIWRGILEAVKSCSDDEILSRAISWAEHEHMLLVFLHPTAEALEFTWEPTGRISVSVKTSTTGPGFHAFCVQLLDRVAENCGLQWSWGDGDEAAFVERRDFSALQIEMARFVRTMANSLLDADRESMSALLLNWPIEAPTPLESAFTITPTGKWSKRWWESAAVADGTDLLSVGREFYPWWDHDRDASFYRNLGCALLWSSVAWHPPLDAEEQQTSELALDACRHAQSLDPDVPVPEAELCELEAMLNQHPDDAQPPSVEGIGFYRHPMRFSTTGRWIIVLPGYFYQRFEDDGELIVFWHGARRVSLSSLSWSGGAGTIEDVLCSEWTEGRDTELVIPTDESLKGRATTSLVSEEGDEYWQLRGKVMAHENLCIITIDYRNQQDRQWAVDTYQSLTHPPS